MCNSKHLKINFQKYGNYFQVYESKLDTIRDDLEAYYNLKVKSFYKYLNSFVIRVLSYLKYLINLVVARVYSKGCKGWSGK